MTSPATGGLAKTHTMVSPLRASVTAPPLRSSRTPVRVEDRNTESLPRPNDHYTHGVTDFAEIAERHGASLLVQYGSTIDGTPHADSDVDIGVLYDRPPPPLLEQGSLAGDLQECFPDRQVDLAPLDRADPLFLARVMAGSRLLAGSPRRFAELKIYAFKRYQDHRRYLPLERRYVDRVLASVGR